MTLEEAKKVFIDRGLVPARGHGLIFDPDAWREACYLLKKWIEEENNLNKTRPHWVNITGRTKGQKFRCSDCKGEVYCITYGNADKYEKRNICDYEYCPRCGKEMDLTTSFIIEKSEKQLEAADE